MTKKRKYEIAVFVMYKQMHALGLNRYSRSDLVREAANYKEFSTQFLVALFQAVLAEQPLINNGTDITGESAYKWIKEWLVKSGIVVNSTSRRAVGNVAREVGLSEIQLIEFHRLICIDVVNRVFMQTEEEVPLKRKG